jgi:hypothetical protein
MSVTIASPKSGTILKGTLPYTMVVNVNYNENAIKEKAGGTWIVFCQLIYPSDTGIIKDQQNKTVVAPSGPVTFSFTISTYGDYELLATLKYFPIGGGSQGHGADDQPSITVSSSV